MDDEIFSEAERFWDLDRLYTDLATANQKSLTCAERRNLRGLLLGFGPSDIAKRLQIDVRGVRVALSNLYHLIGAIAEPVGERVTARNVARVLVRYRRFEGAQSVLPIFEPAPASEPDPIPQRRAKIALSYGNQTETLALASDLHKALRQVGHEVWRLRNSAEMGAELERCDYFLLLLSPQTIYTEMVIEEVRLARELFGTHGKPLILPVRVGFSADEPLNLNHSLRWYLRDTSPWEKWRSPEDTQPLIQSLRQRLESPPLLTPHSPDASPLLQPPVLEQRDAPPLPIAEPELPWGQVERESTFYVERPPIESDCYTTILQPGALIRIKAPRQMGKTSLLSRVLYYAERNKCIGISLNFQLADTRTFTDLDRFLQWFCANVGSILALENRLKEYWDNTFGSKITCTEYFERYLLERVDQAIILGLDEVDRVFQYQEIAADFFGLLRAWHERAKTQAIWKKLRLIVVHSTEVYVPLHNNQSPFNVGLPIELPEFRPDQTWDLADRHGLRWTASAIEQLVSLIGGHPYLVRLALYKIAKHDLSLEHFLKVAATDAGPYDDHLRRHWWNLQQQPDLLTAMQQVVTAPEPIRLESGQAFKLHSMGLVHLNGNLVKPRCELYRCYFRARLVD